MVICDPYIYEEKTGILDSKMLNRFYDLIGSGRLVRSAMPNLIIDGWDVEKDWLVISCNRPNRSL